MNIEELGLNEEQITAVQKYVQSETDKIRTDYSQRLRTANEEIAKYKPVEKSDTEKALEERIAAIEKKEKDIADRERAMNLSAKLKEKELPENLAKYLNVGDDADAAVDEIAKILGGRFLDGTTKPSTHTTNKGVTKKDFAQMSYLERTRLFQENPELYNTMTK